MKSVIDTAVMSQWSDMWSLVFVTFQSNELLPLKVNVTLHAALRSISP